MKALAGDCKGHITPCESCALVVNPFVFQPNKENLIIEIAFLHKSPISRHLIAIYLKRNDFYNKSDISLDKKQLPKPFMLY